MTRVSNQLATASGGRAASRDSSCELLNGPIRASWNAGRGFNRLIFHLQQAWLLVDRQQADLADTAWDELALTVRELVQTVEIRDDLRDAVVDARQNWQDCFGTPAHRQALEDENTLIFDKWRSDPYATMNQLIENACLWLLETLREITEPLRIFIESQLGDAQLQIFRLARHVDEGIRPQTIYREMLQPPAPQRPEQVTAGWNAPADTREPEWHIRRHSRWITTIAPNRQWLREVWQRWTEAGIPAVYLPDFRVNEAEESSESVEIVVGGINTAAWAALAVLDEASAEPRCRLVVDVEHQIAYVDGAPHELGTREAALFVDQVVRGQGEWVSATAMREADSQQLYRVRRDRLGLPDAVEDLIESHSGQGHRLRPAALT